MSVWYWDDDDIVIYDSLQNEIEKAKKPADSIDGWYISFNDTIIAILENQKEADEIFSKIDKELTDVNIIKETSFSTEKPTIRAFKVNGKYYAYLGQDETGLIHKEKGETNIYNRLKLASCKIILD